MFDYKGMEEMRDGETGERFRIKNSEIGESEKAHVQICLVKPK